MRGKRICEMPLELREFLEGHLPELIPANKVVSCWFLVHHIEENRI
ncbi:hypothetical protein [Haloferula sp.]